MQERDCFDRDALVSLAAALEWRPDEGLAHIAACDTCRAELGRLTVLQQMLDETVVPSPGYTDRVAALATAPTAVSTLPPTPGPAMPPAAGPAVDATGTRPAASPARPSEAGSGAGARSRWWTPILTGSLAATTVFAALLMVWTTAPVGLGPGAPGLFLSLLAGVGVAAWGGRDGAGRGTPA